MGDCEGRRWLAAVGDVQTADEVVQVKKESRRNEWPAMGGGLHPSVACWIIATGESEHTGGGWSEFERG